MAKGARVSVGIRKSQRDVLAQVARDGGQTIQALVDKALSNFIRDAVPVYRRMIKELNTPNATR